MEGTVTERDSQWQLLRVDFNGGLYGSGTAGKPLASALVSNSCSRRQPALADEQASSILNRLPATVIGMADDTDRAMLLIRLAAGCYANGANFEKSAFQLRLCQNQRLWVQIKLWLFCIDREIARQTSCPH